MIFTLTPAASRSRASSRPMALAPDDHHLGQTAVVGAEVDQGAVDRAAGAGQEDLVVGQDHRVAAGDEGLLAADDGRHQGDAAAQVRLISARVLPSTMATGLHPGADDAHLAAGEFVDLGGPGLEQDLADGVHGLVVGVDGQVDAVQQQAVVLVVVLLRAPGPP